MTEYGYRFTGYDMQCVREIHRVLTENLDRHYTIPELARQAGINASKLQRCFKELVGTTIFDFHQGMRLEYARYLLRATDDTVQSIGEQCGYAENANFTAAFKKRFGSTPDAFRRALFRVALQ